MNLASTTFLVITGSIFVPDLLMNRQTETNRLRVLSGEANRGLIWYISFIASHTINKQAQSFSIYHSKRQGGLPF